MSEAIVKTQNAISVWDDLENVRAQFAPTLTDKEFSFFVTLGSSLGANPFKREIWAVKYDKNQPASIFLGRDFYRKKAQEQSDYDGHTPDSVYEKDKFKVVNGTPQHEYSLADRGRLLGAYCVAWKKGVGHPFYVFVKIEEYNKNFANWKSMPDTMIKKVAEAQCLRAAWQGVFAGTYDESEQWNPVPTNGKSNVPPPPLKKKEEPIFVAEEIDFNNPKEHDDRVRREYKERISEERQEEPTQEPEYESHSVRPGESEPPDNLSLSGEVDVFTELDTKVHAYCHGDRNNMIAVYKRITGFTGSDGKERSCWNIDQVKKWKNPEKVAGKAMRVFDDLVKMGTKFSFEG
jgi:recombination protein RecT